LQAFLLLLVMVYDDGMTNELIAWCISVGFWIGDRLISMGSEYVRCFSS
jgi:hypothetical protein